MKLTFQDGHLLEGLLNYEATGIIEAWVPMFVFAIMFGISFDDLTFAIGRVRENHERGEDIDTAVRGGLKSVAMTILAADLILAGVVGIFAFMRLLPMQQLGIAMVVAVVLGALLVIVIVMPALLRALGDRLLVFPLAACLDSGGLQRRRSLCVRCTRPILALPSSVLSGSDWRRWHRSRRWTRVESAAVPVSTVSFAPTAACSMPNPRLASIKSAAAGSSPSASSTRSS